MRCAGCGQENRQGRKFCTGCGAPMHTACPACGAASEPGESFCGECGAELRGLGTGGWGLLAAGRLEEAREQLEQAIVLGIDQALLKPFAVIFAVPLRVETHLGRADIDAARALGERGVELARAMGFRHSEAKNLIGLARALVAASDDAGAEAALAQASELVAAVDGRDLLPFIEEARGELARHRGDDAGCERAFRAAARLHRENGEEWLATQAEARIWA